MNLARLMDQFMISVLSLIYYEFGDMYVYIYIYYLQLYMDEYWLGVHLFYLLSEFEKCKLLVYNMNMAKLIGRIC